MSNVLHIISEVKIVEKMCVLIKIIHSYGLDDVYFLVMTNIPSAQIPQINMIENRVLHVITVNQSGNLITNTY